MEDILEYTKQLRELFADYIPNDRTSISNITPRIMYFDVINNLELAVKKSINSEK